MEVGGSPPDREGKRGHRVKARDLGALVALAAVWGGSFLFIRVAAPVVGPVTLAGVRVVLAGLALALYALATRVNLDLRRRWKSFLVVGLLNSAIPFVLIGAAELRLTAGLAAILNATTPLFGALVAAVWLRDRLTVGKVVGLLIGLAGVVLLMGWSSLPLTTTTVLAVGASLLGALSYALASVYTKRAFKGVPALAIATGQQLGAAAILVPITLPVAAVTSPWAHLTPGVLWAMVTLALLCTSAAYIIFFYLIGSVGPVPATSVTFLVPAFGLVWSAIFLHEPLTLGTFGGMAIIFVGVLLVLGVRFPRRMRHVGDAPGSQSMVGAAR